jgi:hypothetical protein
VDVVVSGLLINFLLDPSEALARRFPLCQPDRLEDLWRRAGLTEVTSAPITIATDFIDFGDYWEPFLAARDPPLVT